MKRLTIFFIILSLVWSFMAVQNIDKYQSRIESIERKLNELETEQKSTRALLEHMIPQGQIDGGSTEKPSGKASWYDYSLKGYPDYSKTNLTAAARDWPRGTKLNVCTDSKCVVVRVNDFGPALAVHPDRIIDLSSYAFTQLAPLSAGVVDVVVTEKLD